ncbi:MAG: molecular chaperone HtpG [Gammaproteobacteria bacterium]|nr:molecular chaperone HtpG [Gammaproteobacteria bacterium]
MAKKAAGKPESHEFQAEVSQLLNLMIHSLYSNKEIFMRELISNASDACDKLRFQALQDASLYGDDSELKIHISVDKKAKTITVSDNGIGMNHDEVVANIGTIAKSGTREFLQSLTGDQAKDTQLIGQFGVGFYSSFIVADKVTVLTRKAGDKKAVRWESEGSGTYTLENAERAGRGTDVILHLRKEEAELLDNWRVRSIIRKYSDHISLPIRMLKETTDEKDKKAEEPEWEQVNNTTALWARAKKDIKEEEYKEFYKAIAPDFQDPLAWTHNRVEGKHEYTTLLYIPSQAPFDLWDRDHVHGIKLYVKRVFIMDDSEQLMPKYLRFVRGLVDSNDLPLNVSREILQSNKLIDSIRSGSVKKILGLLETMAKDKPEDYKKFWQNFGVVLKEGPAEDFANKDQIAKLFMFHSTHENGGEPYVKLDEYIARMKEGQDKIYFITADSLSAARNSPHLEAFKKRGIEVLLMSDRIDEWMMQFLTEYDGKKFVSVSKGDLDLGALDSEEEKTHAKEVQEAAKDIVERIKKALADKVEDVRATTRLTDSPACVVLKENEMALHMQRLMKQAGHEVPAIKPVLEINPTHDLIKRIEAEKDDNVLADWAGLLLDQAIVAEGGQLENPAEFVKKLNKLLLT